MIDTRAVGQELQDQLRAAARKGHRRVTNTVKNVTATAQMIRPQLPTMPPIRIAKLPSPDQLVQLTEKQFSQLRERAPGLIARLPSPEDLAKLTEKQISQLREKAPGLFGRLPNADHLKAGATDLAGQVRSVQRQFVGQVRTVASPLAHHAAAAFAQATGQATESGREAAPTAAVTGNGAASASQARTPASDDGKTATAGAAQKAHSTEKSRPAAKAKPGRAQHGTATPKKSKPTTK